MPPNFFIPAFFHASRRGLQHWLLYFALTCAALTLASPAQAQTASDTGLLRLLSLMQQRLDLAQDVAMYKWNTRAAIDDSVREQQILDALAKQAPEYGLEPKLAQDFFAAQIIAGKLIQTALFKEWTNKSQALFENPPDLKTKIRPALDKLTTELLMALAAAQPVLQGKDSQQTVELTMMNASVQAGVSQTVPGYAAAWQYALSALSKSR
ncbi:gamma subclass chorismate mutase AroQ [Undibacterium pigrum]|uniref:chorismate mutase n=1 Tax=Undibacterium pigrum TaxID=401470 RepID=A0A318J677_9BURK|nr:gamma subclass chorismate mutase AroQ [Undibacterium pigrum]PXX42652.1 chorismate mutase [Undibacterium pigrum]